MLLFELFNEYLLTQNTSEDHIIRIADKHEYFRANAEWNMVLNYGLGDDEEE